jgi:hypothetical protein
MKILLGDFNVNVGREDIFKLAVRNDINKDNVVRVVKFLTSENMIVKSTMFSHCNIYKKHLDFT